MHRASPLIMLAVVAVAALIGYSTMPRYRPPADGGEDRLRQRAVEYYRAQKQVDFLGMARHFSPARQIAEAEELSKTARERGREAAHISQATRGDLDKSAEAVTPDILEVQLEGRWAVTSGESTIYTDGHEVSAPLGSTVWVQVEGDWWVFSMTPDELNAYGNAPDFARDILLKNKRAGAKGYGVSIGGEVTQPDNQTSQNQLEGSKSEAEE